MSQLVETLLFDDGRLHHVWWHNERLNRTRLSLFGQSEPIDLATAFENWALQKPIESYKNSDFYFRCRVLYDQSGISKIEIVKTQRRLIKTIQLITDDLIEYDHKWTNRTALDLHFKGIKADDILIVKNGLLTDTYYANVVFRKGQDWITPATPLLKGTKRAQLLYNKAIIEEHLTVSDLKRFSEVRLINASTELHASVPIAIENIKFVW